MHIIYVFEGTGARVGDSSESEHLIPGQSEHTIPGLTEHPIPSIILTNSARNKSLPTHELTAQSNLELGAQRDWNLHN